MKKWTTIVSSSFVAVALAIPVDVAGQGRHAPAGAPTSGTAAPRDSGGDSGSAPAPRSESAPSTPRVAYPSTPSASDRTSSRTATTRRDRGDRPQVGTAQARQRGSFPTSPSYQYSTRPYPYWWYSGYAPGFGFGAYDLWSWGSHPGSWWYSPYGYSAYDRYRPYGYGYGDGYGYGGSTSRRSDRDDDAFDDRPTGSIRLRVSPRTAKVYVDGALVGVVDDFDGLSDHLALDPGIHQLELRAPGYQSFVTDVSVSEGKTITTRASMKKDK